LCIFVHDEQRHRRQDRRRYGETGGATGTGSLLEFKVTR
jgi:hypothetical protein